jgi:multicomponent Na+:H+ antiporter subunit C
MTIIKIFLDNYPYFLSTILIMIGMWGMLAKHNLLKKLIGMNIFQTAIIMLFICSSYKAGSTIPILQAGADAAEAVYTNPLPHVLMLTAIVVMVATSGVALAILILIHRRYNSLDEKEILHRMKG